MKSIFLSGIAAAIFMPMSLSAQPMMGRGGGFNQGGNPFGDDTIKTQIRASDEEWKVIGPKLQKVTAARQALENSAAVLGTMNNGGGNGDFGGRGRGDFGGRGGPGNDSFAGPADSASGGRGPRGGRGGFGRGGPGGGDFGPGGPDGGGFGPGPTTGPNENGDFTRGPGSRGDFGPGGFGRGGRGGPGGPGGPGGGGGLAAAITQPLSDLQTALADKTTTDEQLKEKVAAVRAARQKVKVDLAAAEKDLKLLLTPDQEAVLVQLDYID